MVSAGRLKLSLGLLGAGLVGGAKRYLATAISASQRRTQLDLSLQLGGFGAVLAGDAALV
jgi:hypothetical protein